MFEFNFLLIFYFMINSITCNESCSKKQNFFLPVLPIRHINCWLKKNLPEKQFHEFFKLCHNKCFDSIVLDSQNNHKSLVEKVCEEVLYILKHEDVYPCWGYETWAKNKTCLLYKPICNGSSRSWAKNEHEQIEIFFNTADFGYVEGKINELKHYCLSNSSIDYNASELICTEFMRFCKAKNIYINFERLLQLDEPIRYREDVLAPGSIGGWNCTLKRTLLSKENDHKSPLMSWFSELSNFEIQSNFSKCDIFFNKPTFIMKLDATTNMYHHFCDFINLYLTFHLNGSFFLDNDILIWDTFSYKSNFAPVFKAFTKNPIQNLNSYKGKTICFRDVVFPLLPRMVFGFYYNMPLIPGCEKSGVFRSFNRHLLLHLNMKTSEELSSEEKIRLTFITRKTQYRKIVNQNELILALKRKLISQKKTNILVQTVDFSHQMPFIEQVKISSISDILIGIHGAGLTHTLFQPDYGVLFELYNCGDHDCYKDLARLRGVHYMTWRDPKKLKFMFDKKQKKDQVFVDDAHAKFVNYYLDVEEFVFLCVKAIEIVEQRKNSFDKQNSLKHLKNQENKKQKIEL